MIYASVSGWESYSDTHVNLAKSAAQYHSKEQCSVVQNIDACMSNSPFYTKKKLLCFLCLSPKITHNNDGNIQGEYFPSHKYDPVLQNHKQFLWTSLCNKETRKSRRIVCYSFLKHSAYRLNWWLIDHVSLTVGWSQRNLLHISCFINQVFNLYKI